MRSDLGIIRECQSPKEAENVCSLQSSNGIDARSECGPRLPGCLTVLPVLPLSVCDHSSLKHCAGHQFVISALGCCLKVAPQNTGSERVATIQNRFLGQKSLKNSGLSS